MSATAASQAREDRWGWCRTPTLKQQLSPQQSSMSSTGSFALVKTVSEPRLIGGRSLLCTEPPIPMSETRQRFGVALGNPHPAAEATPFWGLSRPRGDTQNMGRIGGGRHAVERWAGTHPLKGPGVSDGRVTCNGRGIPR
mmetsp:Transcript_93898/g.269141  ORF Transcript_93898/g.269141 Transcript_93898/m.269141 type:complete len:140 (+) Transcript_93898:85-504(+)